MTPSTPEKKTMKPEQQSRFGDGEPIWPANSDGLYTAQFQLSCGYVIVNPAGIESTLGYQNKQQAECVAESLTEGHAIGKAETADTISDLRRQLESAEKDIEILMAAIDKVAYRNTIGPAMFTHIGEAGQNEIDLRIEIVDKARKSTQTWKDTDAQLDAEEKKETP